MSEVRYAVGIDLGTTHCVMSYVDLAQSDGDDVVPAIVPSCPRSCICHTLMKWRPVIYCYRGEPSHLIWWVNWLAIWERVRQFGWFPVLRAGSVILALTGVLPYCRWRRRTRLLRYRHCRRLSTIWNTYARPGIINIRMHRCWNSR
jgi:hypothetical protein